MENFKRAFKLWNHHRKMVEEINKVKEPEMLTITQKYIAYCVNSNN